MLRRVCDVGMVDDESRASINGLEAPAQLTPEDIFGRIVETLQVSCLTPGLSATYPRLVTKSRPWYRGKPE